MSLLFGDRTPAEHERLIYGAGGLFELTQDPRDRCAAWVPSTPMHTFLVTDLTASMRAGDQSAREFARAVIEGEGSLANAR